MENMEGNSIDTVCGIGVNKNITGYKAEFEGKLYYFCSPLCESAFKRHPEKYIKRIKAKA